jgi:glycosyltransferase involved in cell wall biosynthesis
MLRIAFLIDNLRTHGGVRRCIEMANALVMRGHWVSVHVPDGKSCDWLACLAQTQDWKVLAGLRPDALILFGFGDDFLQTVEAAQPKQRVFYLLSLSEPHADQVLTLANPKAKRLREVLRSPDWLILACSTWVAEWLQANIRPDAHLLLGGINRTIFHPVKVKRAKGQHIILSSGDSREREGSIAVAEAIKIVASRGYPVVLKTYHKSGIPQSEMARTYCEASIFLDGQHYGGWANGVAEAMACGTPVVCTNIGAVRDFAIDGETALLVPVEDREAMVAAVIRLLEDAELAQRLRVNGLKTVERFSYADMAQRFEALLGTQP